MVAALSILVLMLSKKQSGYNKQKTRTAVLFSLFIRENGSIDVFMLIFAHNGQTSMILFAHGVAVSIHCNLQQPHVLFAQETAASFCFNFLRRAVPCLILLLGKQPINFRLSKEINSSWPFAEHKMGSASVYA